MGCAMKLVTFRPRGAASAAGRLGAVVPSGYVDLNSADPRIPADAIQFLTLGDEAWKLARDVLSGGRAKAVHAGEVVLLAPIPRPGKVFCIGLNYLDHAIETGAQPPKEPVVFNKFPTSVIGPDEAIVLPRVSDGVDYEAELVVVVGKGGKHIPEAQAMEHVAGYCCGHDVSARDWQKSRSGGQWLLGKSFDTFGPLGPWLVSADEIADPGKLRIQFRLSGETLQDSSTAQLIFPVPRLIAHLSQVVTLQPGDVIYTGTPPGVGMARKPPRFMRDGEVAEVEIEGLGVLRNPVVAEAV